ncbi:MAG: Uma2 family endonuclease [Ktedonobacterales bacterium]
MAAVPKYQTLTAEDFAALPREGLRLELIQGEIFAMPPASGGHGKASMRLGGLLFQYVMAHDLGEIYAAETGFLVERNPDTVRAPDVAFICKDRLPPAASDSYWVLVIPDLVAEVVSSTDRPKDIGEKVAMWLTAGVRMVVVVRPPERLVEVYRATGNQTLLLRDGDTLTGDDVVPGFAAPVARIFGP